MHMTTLNTLEVRTGLTHTHTNTIEHDDTQTNGVKARVRQVICR